MTNFERPVARELVHRQSTSEVLPTDFETLSTDCFEVSLQWPRRHGFFNTLTPGSAIVAESIRQITILACHVGYDVEHSTRFLMTGLGFEILRTSPLGTRGRALELTAIVSGTEVRKTPRGALRSARLNVVLADDEGVIAVGHGDALIAVEAAYQRLRGSSGSERPPAARRLRPIPAWEVGCRSEDDVVLGRTGLGLEVDVDGNHPIFFDHLLDHVPGVALIEACRQAASVALGDPALDLRRFEAEFARVVEFEAPATITSDFTGTGVKFEIRQVGVTAMAAEATVSASASAVVAAG